MLTVYMHMHVHVHCCTCSSLHIIIIHCTYNVMCIAQPEVQWYCCGWNLVFLAEGKWDPQSLSLSISGVEKQTRYMYMCVMRVTMTAVQLYYTVHILPFNLALLCKLPMIFKCMKTKIYNDTVLCLHGACYHSCTL